MAEQNREDWWWDRYNDLRETHHRRLATHTIIFYVLGIFVGWLVWH